MKDIYNDQTHLRNNPTWHEEDAPFKTARILKLLRRNTLPLGTICDVGCGSGEVLFGTEPVYKRTSPKQQVVHFLREALFKVNARFCTRTLGGYSLLVLTKNPAS